MLSVASAILIAPLLCHVTYLSVLARRGSDRSLSGEIHRNKVWLELGCGRTLTDVRHGRVLPQPSSSRVQLDPVSADLCRHPPGHCWNIRVFDFLSH